MQDVEERNPSVLPLKLGLPAGVLVWYLSEGVQAYLTRFYEIFRDVGLQG